MRIGILLIILLIVFPIEIKCQEKEWLLNKDSIFTSTTSTHFNLFTIDGHISTEIKNQILNERELAYKQIAEFLGINLNIEIDIFLFQNEELKYDITGHKGYGWGFDNIIVEVYNDSIKVDPYHELVHILGYKLSTPPALLDEGLAVYLSQKYGNKPFSKLLGYPTQSINEILTLLLKRQELIDIPTLFSFNDIGEASNVVLAYCQSASLVDYLINHYGKTKFLEFYSSCNTYNNAQNVKNWVNVYDTTIKQIEMDWIITNRFDKK